MIKLSETTLDSLLSPYDLSHSTVEYLGGGREDSDGICFSFRQDGKPMVVKLLAWKEPEEAFAFTRKRVEERVAFAFYLGCRGADVVNPVKDGGGRLYRHSHDGQYGYLSYLMDRAEGEPPAPELWDDALLGQWGAAVGRMHRLAGQYEHWRQSPHQGADGQPLLGWRNEVRGFRDWCRDSEVKERWVEMERRLEQLPMERDCFGFIHNDPHGHNILFDGSAVKVIDFDVANYHWFMTDMAIALQSALFTWGGMERPVTDAAAVQRFFHGFLAGYEREHHLSGQWLGRLGLFVNYRRMLLFTVMQDWLDSNAELKESWKRMILEEPDVS